MEKKIELILRFLEKLGIDRMDVQVQVIDDHVDWINDDADIVKDGKWVNERFIIRTPIDRYIEQIVDEYIDEIVSNNVSNGTGFFRVNLEFNQVEKFLKITSEEQYYDTQGTGIEYDNLEEEKPNWYDEISKLFNEEENVKYFTMTYEGSGDSGYISNRMESSTDVSLEVPEEIGNIIYNILNKNFSGWEINEGSEGEIIIYPNKIEVGHSWNTEDWAETNLNITIKV